MGGTLLERIRRGLVERDGGCWQWLGSRDAKGNARIAVGGKMVLLHRLVYELEVGAIPEGKDVARTCGDRSCVNPLHLEVRDRGERMRRRRCPAGHDLTDPAVVWVSPTSGRRQCRPCAAARARRRRMSWPQIAATAQT